MKVEISEKWLGFSRLACFRRHRSQNDLTVISFSLPSGSGMAIAPERRPGRGLSGAGTNASGSLVGKSPGGAPAPCTVAARLRSLTRLRLSRPLLMGLPLFCNKVKQLAHGFASGHETATAVQNSD